MSFVDKVEGIRRGLATTYCPWCPLTRSQPTTFRVKDYRYPLDLVNATRTHTGESLCDVRAFSQITPSILSASNVIIRSQMHTLTSRHVTSRHKFGSLVAVRLLLVSFFGQEVLTRLYQAQMLVAPVCMVWCVGCLEIRRGK